MQTMKQYLNLVSDALLPKPIIAQHLLVAGNDRTAQFTVVNMLSLPPHILRAPRLAPRVSKALAMEDENAMELRKVYSQLVEQTLRMANSSKGDKNRKHD